MGSESQPTANEPQTVWGLVLRWTLGQEANTVLLVLILVALGYGLRDFFQVGLPAIESRHREERESLLKAHREERDALSKQCADQQAQWRETFKQTIDALKEKGMADAVVVPAQPLARR